MKTVICEKVRAKKN